MNHGNEFNFVLGGHRFGHLFLFGIYMDKDKQYHYENFLSYITEVLSIYNQQTNQEDYTDSRRYTSDTSGKNFKKYQKENWRMLEAIEKVKVAYRFAQSKWR